MALKKLAQTVPGRKDPADVTLIYEGEPLKFSRPRVADLNPTKEQFENIGRNYPSLRFDQIYTIHVMGMGYVPEASEGSIVAWKEFAEIATTNDLAFADLARQWEKAFPEFSGWTAARLSAKNDLGAQEGLDTALPTLPPVLEGSPES